MSDIPGVTLVPTVRRQSWHAPDDRWQCVGTSGGACAHPMQPIMDLHGEMPGIDAHTGLDSSYPDWINADGQRPFTVGPQLNPPPDWTTTLRRIVSDEMDEATKVREMRVKSDPVHRGA